MTGTIAVCHCSVLWLRGRVTTNFGGVDVVPLLDAIAGCHCSVLWLSGRGAIAGCHCSVLWLGGWVTINFGGVDVVRRPTLREWTWCHCWMQLQGAIVVCHG